ncbi:hypothetical protein E3U55_13310 [Filobacillus milosensis]|uniref:DUF5067 domain-containing protein n=1 Tax=Filobacillus milosensis TaxID=94137 RepID=A0A4Y8IHY4_9BACI|nr:hypothetical protein [Filobacillus milosensis]TFB14603.1 hypothetical protein E3U55_13310 [Filobacillus milosensis]
MKKVWLLVLLGLLVACKSTGAPSDKELNKHEVTDTSSEVRDGDFIYRLVTEQAEYEDGKDVKVYAELEYDGDQEFVEIVHGATPLYFPAKEVTRGYEMGYATNDPQLSTTLKRGEPIRKEYTGSGGFSMSDPEEYINFIHQVTDGDFPKGFYKIQGYADFSYNGVEYKIETEVQFKVTDEGLF